MNLDVLEDDELFLNTIYSIANDILTVDLEEIESINNREKDVLRLKNEEPSSMYYKIPDNIVLKMFSKERIGLISENLKNYSGARRRSEDLKKELMQKKDRAEFYSLRYENEILTAEDIFIDYYNSKENLERIRALLKAHAKK